MTYLDSICQRAKSASRELATTDTEQKNRALKSIALALEKSSAKIIKENQKDIEKAVENGMTPSLIDRLTLTDDRIRQMAEGIRQVAELDDSIGETIEERTLSNGLNVSKIRVPFGVIGVIYESRPNVTCDTAALCLKASSAVVLRGGSDAFLSNKILSSIMRDAIEKEGLNPWCITFLEDTSRECATNLMKKNEYLDLLIPRGGAGLIKSVVENATVPVIETGTGNCHIYIDEDFDEDMALDIVINAKTSRTGVCNAAESLLIHKNVSDAFLLRLQKALKERNVEIRGCSETIKRMPCDLEATQEDFAKEFLSLTISVKMVESVHEAIDHIEMYSTRHSEAIITKIKQNAELFTKKVDSAAVYVNASTRFTDGFEFGLGAEIGISTQKLHARGPMGLKEISSYKYVIKGNGQTR